MLDSFDEIPAVLDHDEEFWLIELLSNAIVTCVLGGKNSRAIIASRLFRKPKVSNQERSVYEIRPFSDDRMVHAINIAANEPNRLAQIILTERRDLGAIGRNPFLLQLIISHYNLTSRAPSAQAEMFETFFDSNIRLARSTFGFKELNKDQIYEICENIADTMFNRENIGLEISDVELQKEVKSAILSDVLRFLAQARIGRIATASGTFSFAHRRFNEYFLVRRLASGRSAVPYDAIQSDSRWRDALVLYAEIAGEAEAEKLAAHAWGYASRLGTISLGASRSDFITARHALRFLIEGYRNRPALLGSFHTVLKDLIAEKITSENDYIEIKTVVEAVGLLPIEKSYSLILDILRGFPGWISEQAAAAARYLPRIDTKLAEAIFYYCVSQPGFRGLKEAKQRQSIFAISDAFRTLVNWLKWYRIDTYKLIFACVFVVSVRVMVDYRSLLPLFLALVMAPFMTIPVVSIFTGKSASRNHAS